MVRDPSGLVQLFQEVDRRLHEILDACNATWVNQACREELHAQVHTTINTLFTTIFNDLRDLEVSIGKAVFAADDTFPTLEETAVTLQSLFGSSNTALSEEAARDRIRWIMFQWIQLQTILYGLLSSVPAVSEARKQHFPDLDDPPTKGSLEEPHLIAGCVGRLQELTAEYLEARSGLLAASGKPAAGVQVHWERTAADFMRLTWNAYYRGEPSASYLLLLTIRRGLLELLQLDRLSGEYDLVSLRTHHLVVVAANAQVALPVDPNVIGNILVDLESASARCEPVKQMMLLPLVRIGDQFVDGLKTTRLTQDQTEIVRQQLRIGGRQSTSE